VAGKANLLLTAALAVAAVLVLSACGGSGADRSEPPPDAVRVASFNFAESELLAEMYAQVIESSGIPVVRLGAVGPREIVAPAMEVGRIDLVPEYLGTALQYAGASEPNPDPDSARTELNGILTERGLTALQASPAEDKNVIVVTGETADREGLATISDLSAVAAELRFGGPAECQNRPLCLGGLETVYGLRFSEFVAQRSLEFTAEALRRGEIEVGLMFSTASELEKSDLVVLVDDRLMQPAENVVPIIRDQTLQRWGPALEAELDALSANLTTEELRALNLGVAEGRSVEDLARSWLSANDLVDQN